jgi:hypothetical protein
MNMHKSFLLIAVLVACGGHKQADTTPDTGGGTAEPPPTNTNENMVPPEKMDEITQDLKRKNNIVSRCLAIAMENRDVPKGTRGRVTFEIKISTEGHAFDVKVVKSDIQTQSVLDCAKKHVEEIAFPTLPRTYETSYTFSMEAN